MLNYNAGLFEAIVKDDFKTAAKLTMGASGEQLRPSEMPNPNAIFQIEKAVFVSSFNLLVRKVATFGISKGPGSSQYQLGMQLIKRLMPMAVVECKCSKEHKCPLFTAIKACSVTKEEQILEQKYDLVRYLLTHGATIRFQQSQDKKAVKKDSGKWTLRWMDLEGLKCYLITKNFTYVETKIQ